MYVPRKGRRFLEVNQNLLEYEIDKELKRLIIAHAEDKIEMKQQMHNHLMLWQDIQRRGGTSQAVREAYIDVYGGFALDLPSWLEAIEKRRMFLSQLRRPERTIKAHILLLRDSLSHATSHDANLAPEIIAELQNHLGHLLLQNTFLYTQEARTRTIEEAIACHEAAIKIFTAHCYPIQHAKSCFYLGNAYQHFHKIYQNSIESAIACYETALLVHTRDNFPEQWAMLQTHLGLAYAQRKIGEPRDNLEHAMTYHKMSLQVATGTTFPTVQAMALANLGNAYRQRIAGTRVNNLKQALLNYKAALQIYTRQTFPREWADIHMKQALIFQDLITEINEKQDIYLQCAIVCAESALQIFTLDSFPVEYAQAQTILGHSHRMRSGGDQQATLEQACKCYHNALRVFTCYDFPKEHYQLLDYLRESEEQRQGLL